MKDFDKYIILKDFSKLHLSRKYLYNFIFKANNIL